MICGAIFVLLVAAKLLFPDAVGRLAESARQLIGRDADFKEAFAAVGRAVSGEGPVGDSLQDAYSAVFNPADPTEPEAVPVEPEQQPSPQPEPEDEANAPSSTDTGAQLLRHSTLPLPEADRMAVAALGEDLHGDEETICKAISLVTYQLAKALEESFRRKPEEDKRTAALCLSGAALLVILLL